MKSKNQTAKSKNTLNLRLEKTVSARRLSLEKELNISLPHIGTYSLDDSIAASRHCENMIGVTQIPVGIAGPLRIQNSELGIKNYFLPLATTEGALVASVNRGCKVVFESGGAWVRTEQVGTTRGPVFETSSQKKAVEFTDWLRKNTGQLSEISQSTSHHLSFLRHDDLTIGSYTFVRFYFDTQDAMGMNMVTVATQKLAEFIESKTGVRCVSLAGNFDVDKKPAWLNFTHGRGWKVWAEVTLSEEVLKDILKTTAQKMQQVWWAKCMLGSAVSGSIGFNAHFANVVAALFIATGQDPAHVVEGSLGVTTTEIVTTKTRPALKVSVYLPSVMVGTIGGGTALPTQKEALEILGVAGGNEGQNAREFAEIVGGAVLAGEISLLASLTENSLAAAHERLGRGRK